LALIAAAGAAGWYYYGRPTHRPTTTAEPKHVTPAKTWDGHVHLSPDSQAAIGLTLVQVKPQSEPIPLELLGTTKYDEETLSRVRPMLKGRVDQVHAAVGQTVKKGEPLIDLYSTELAEAKSSYEVAQIHWA
jgi:cobalt-zinc-cadmium efflux system membrane fusion protein